MPIIVDCDYCGEPTQKSPSTLTRNKHNFCSRRCSGLFRRKREIVDCANCGNELERHRYRIAQNENHFCDYACQGEWLKENGTGDGAGNWKPDRAIVRCAHCGKEKRVSPSTLELFERHYCSQECKYTDNSKRLSGEGNGMWRGGKTRGYYGPNWHRQRRKARERDSHTCQYCGLTEKKSGQQHDVHHIIPFREFGYIPGENNKYKEANKLSNLVTLCHPCHMSAEAGNIPVQPNIL